MSMSEHGTFELFWKGRHLILNTIHHITLHYITLQGIKSCNHIRRKRVGLGFY